MPRYQGKFLRVRNQAKFQHYKDRNPPWIKLHQVILEDYEFLTLTDASKWHAIACTLLASRIGNHLPYDAKYIQKRINSSKPPDLKALIEIGFLEECACGACCKQDASELHQNADSEKRRVEKRESREGAALPESLATDRFKLKWDEWLSYRKEKRKPVSKRAAEKQLSELAPHGVALAMATIDKSIANDWQGLFPEKVKPTPKDNLPGSGWDQPTGGWGKVGPDDFDEEGNFIR